MPDRIAFACGTGNATLDGGNINVIRYECDKCGLRMGANDARRYICKIEIYAAAGHVDATELSTGSSLEAVINQLKNANPDDIEDQTYRVYRFDLCESCRKIIQASPLGEKLAEGTIRRPPSSSANQ